MKKILSAILILTLLLSLCAGASAAGNRGEIHWGILAGIETVDLNGSFEMGGNVPLQRYDVYMTMDSLISGLMNGRSDACYINKSIADYITNRNEGIESALMPDQGNLRFMMGVNAEKAELYERLNAALKELIDDGTVAALTEQWIDHFPADREPDFKEPLTIEGASETIVVGVTGGMPPIDYMAVDGTPSGFNVALLQKLGRKMGVNIDLISLASEARIVALASGRIDVAFWINSVDAVQGNFIDGVLLTEPYASSEICMIYTAGDHDRIMRAVNQVHAAENILTDANMEEIYAFGHADPGAADALLSLVYEASKLTLTERESDGGCDWALSLGETVLASGSVARDDAYVDSASTLAPGVCLHSVRDATLRLPKAIAGAAFASGASEIDGQTYTASAPLEFSLSNRALMQLRPLFLYFSENGAIQTQAADLLALIDAKYAGTLYQSEADGARYLDASAQTADGARLRFFGTLSGDAGDYTLLLARGDANLDDAAAFRAAVQDGSVDGMALTIASTGAADAGTVEIEGVSTNFGMLQAPRMRFAIHGERTADGAQYRFSALDIDVFTIELIKQTGDADAPAQTLESVDGDVMSDALAASLNKGLTALREALAEIVPLTGDYLQSILG